MLKSQTRLLDKGFGLVSTTNVWDWSLGPYFNLEAIISVSDSLEAKNIGPGLNGLALVLSWSQEFGLGLEALVSLNITA